MGGLVRWCGPRQVQGRKLNYGTNIPVGTILVRFARRRSFWYIGAMQSVAGKTERRALRIIDCGVARYEDVLEVQQGLHEQVRLGDACNTVVVVEHPAVITLGARASANKLLVRAEELKERGIDVAEVRRGGGTTAHNPGQVVFYPILKLAELHLGVSEYIRTVEATGAELLERFGVGACRRDGFPGLWVGDRKIASVGVRVSKGVTCHGMAINIQNDLSLFEWIVPCGLEGVEMTSLLRETGRVYPMAEVKVILSGLLERYFGRWGT